MIQREQFRNLQRFRCLSIVACLLCLGSMFSGCKKPDDVAAPEVEVQAAKAQRQPLTEYVYGNTTLSPHAQAAIASKISAPIKKFLVQRGDRVKAGQLLAVLENADLVAAVDDAGGHAPGGDEDRAGTVEHAGGARGGPLAFLEIGRAHV